MATEAIRSWSHWCARVDSIEPVDGWSLYSYTEEDGDGFTTTGYFASDGMRDVFLDHARCWFTPTQDRFDYLVRAGFPNFGGIGPFTDEDVDVAIVRQRAATQVRHGLAEAQAIAIAMVLS